MSIRATLAAALLLMATSVVAQSEQEALERRLQRVEDQLAIQRVIVDYAVRLDARDLDGYVELFAEEGMWQIGDTIRRGRSEIKEMLVSLYGETEIEPFGYQSFRLVANIEVDVDGDRATARSRHLSFMRGEKGNPNPVLTGLYEDEFIREDGEWRILHRIDYPIMPTAEEWRRQIAEMQGQTQE